MFAKCVEIFMGIHCVGLLIWYIILKESSSRGVEFLLDSNFGCLKTKNLIICKVERDIPHAALILILGVGRPGQESDNVQGRQGILHATGILPSLRRGCYLWPETLGKDTITISALLRCLCFISCCSLTCLPHRA